MRQRSLHEFESLFERASIPVLDIEPVKIGRIAVVCEGATLDGSALETGDYLKRRFAAEGALLWSSDWDDESALSVASRKEFQPASEAFTSTEELVSQIGSTGAKLVVLPVSDASPAFVGPARRGCRRDRRSDSDPPNGGPRTGRDFPARVAQRHRQLSTAAQLFLSVYADRGTRKLPVATFHRRRRDRRRPAIVACGFRSHRADCRRVAGATGSTWRALFSRGSWRPPGTCPAKCSTVLPWETY